MEDVRGQLRVLLAQGRLELPLPGAGATKQRWEALAAFGRADLVLAKIAEGHADAVAILAELGQGSLARPDQLLAVWASATGRTGLTASATPGGGWCLEGRLRFCSGVLGVDAALVPAAAPDGHRLFLLPVADPGVVAVPGTWPAVGMARSESLDVRVEAVTAAEPVGLPGAYLHRPGFWVGGAGIAAVWAGGARGVLDDVLAVLAVLAGSPAGPQPDPHALAHVGAMVARLVGLDAALAVGAEQVDADPSGDHRRLALALRHLADATATEVLDRAGRATGAAPLCLDERHARRTADLAVYVRQTHAERDLADLGRAALAAATDPASGGGRPR